MNLSKAYILGLGFLICSQLCSRFIEVLSNCGKWPSTLFVFVAGACHRVDLIEIETIYEEKSVTKGTPKSEAGKIDAQKSTLPYELQPFRGYLHSPSSPEFMCHGIFSHMLCLLSVAQLSRVFQSFFVN